MRSTYRNRRKGINIIINHIDEVYLIMRTYLGHRRLESICKTFNDAENFIENMLKTHDFDGVKYSIESHTIITCEEEE